MLSIADSILFRYHIKDVAENLEKLKVFFIEFNKKFCCPEPLTDLEIDSIWNSAVKYVEQNKDFSALPLVSNKDSKIVYTVNENKNNHQSTILLPYRHHHYYIIL